MEQNFEERKSNYIAYVLDEYKSHENNRIRKVFPTLGYDFIATNKYEIPYFKKDSLKEELVIKHTLGKYIILITLTIFIIISAMRLNDVWYINILIFLLAATILIILSFIKIGKPIIVINANSLFTKESGDMAWSNVVMTFFKIYYDDGDYKVHSLIIHHFDLQSDNFKASEITVQSLNTRPQEIAFYIDRFSKWH